MKYESNPPNAAALMNSARSFGNYDLPAALADLIDNSITAGAARVDVVCDFGDGTPVVSITDDGCGMTRDDLRAAMRPASRDPTLEREPNDLGRFGWGLKSASLSQCRCLTVITRKHGEVSGAQWDLGKLNGWDMGWLEGPDLQAILAEHPLISPTGTVVLWTDCDRLSEDGDIGSSGFNNIVNSAIQHLSLVFHRYLPAGRKDKGRLRLTVNGTPLLAHDPFLAAHPATIVLPEERIPVGNEMVKVSPFVLPHYSKLTESEQEAAGGEGGFIRNQGFYVYRNERLLLHGTWFRMARFGELSQLVRIRVDFPNSLDQTWKLTLDKSDAQLPTSLRDRLAGLVTRVKSKSTGVHRPKGGTLDSRHTHLVWNRYARHGEVKYRLERDHPVLAALETTLGEEQKVLLNAALSMIEQNVPVVSIQGDASRTGTDVNNTPTRRADFLELLDAVLPRLMATARGDRAALLDLLKRTEPFAQNLPIVEERLAAMGLMP